MNSKQQPTHTCLDFSQGTKKPNHWRTFGIIVIIIIVIFAVGYWMVTAHLFPSSFTPVVLSEQKQKQLNQKIHRLDPDKSSSAQQNLKPEAYDESQASREIYFSEKELNALVHKNTKLGNKLAIDLSQNLASAKLLVDVNPDFPVLGGKTIKVTGGMELELIDGRLSARFKGISVWGVPLPNAWLGNMKEIDLVQKFGQAGGFWQAINQGVEEIEVKEGKLRIKLRK